jgi:ferredoxin
MAQQPPRFEKGVGAPKGVGEYFVADQCIDCDLCRQMAPAIFQRKFMGTGGISFVARQPENNFERQKADEARDACPVGAIQLQTPAQLMNRDPGLEPSLA